MFRIKRKYFVLVILALITTGLLVWFRAFVFENVAVTLNERIQSLKISGFNITYDSLHVDWLGNVIEIDNLLLEKNTYDTACAHPEFISVALVRAEGLSLIQLLFRKTLVLEAVHLEGARMVLHENSRIAIDSISRQRNEFSLRVDRVVARHADIVYTDSAYCETIAGVKSHLSMRGLRLDFHVNKPFAYNVETMTLDSVEVRLPAQFYTMRAKQMVLNMEKKAFRADSIEVIPDLGKLEHGRKHGFEIDRYECAVPSLAASGLSFARGDSLEVRASLAEIQFTIKVFRDKRLPFVRKTKALPVALLHDLPFPLHIDSLKVRDSFVQYDEIVEATSEPGGIFFDNMNAVLSNVSSVSRSGNMTLRAHARLYGQGNLALFATFPFDEQLRSSVSGNIRDFSLPKLNAILTPSTQLMVESGNMKELSYNFTFNDRESQGEVALNYENLKLATYKDEEKTDGEGREKDNFKTFMINTFVFKKNMTEDMPEEKRTGTVSYVRDEARSIFNFWSKSLVSGIKSAYDLDKPAARNDDRESKKEERMSRREARKQKRAEKKKERG